MDTPIDAVILLLVALTSLSSWQGLKNSAYADKYAFEVDGILIGKQYYRLLTSGFLHVSWMHLIFNMVSLYAFGGSVGEMLGVQNFLLLYFVSLAAGSLLALFIHRNHGDYSAVGASGAISGVMFASILFFPDASVGFPFVPDFAIKAWFYGVAYMLISIYGIKSQTGVVCHEGHVGGAIAGILTAVCLEPTLVTLRPWLLAGLLVPFIAFMVLIVTKPEVMLIEGYWGYTPKKKEAVRNQPAIDEEAQLNQLLDKMSEKGIDALSKKERALLEKLSGKVDKGM